MTALVLLPGMDGTGELFADFVLALKDEVRPVIIGYPENQALGYEDLEEYVRDRLPINEPFILLGESFSGPIAISIASSAPAGLIGLILCCTFASNPLPLLRPIKSLINVLPISSKLTTCIVPFLLGKFSSRSLRKNLEQTLGKVSSRTLRRRMQAVFDIDVSNKLGKIQIPILYIQAEDDSIVPVSALKKICEYAKKLKIVKLRAPHLLLQTVPLEAATAVKIFIQEARTSDVAGFF